MRMVKRLGRITAVAGVLALLVAATFTAAHAAPTIEGVCSQVSMYRAVFPTAGAVRFTKRSAVRRAALREPFKDRKCGYFWTTYTGYAGTGAYVDVSVTLFKTRRDAVLALSEPIAGPVQTLSNGVRVRTRVRELAADSGVTSIVRNALITSTGAGPHDGTFSGREAVNAEMRIHRRIHAAVLALR